MAVNKEELIKKLRKIDAMVKGGAGGETINARRLLIKTAEKYGINLDELDDVNRKKRYTKCSRGWKQHLMKQVFFKFVPDVEIWSTVGKKGFVIECSESDYISTLAKYEIFAYDYRRRVNAFIHAYIEANNLFGDPDPDYVPRPMTEAQRRKARLIIEMSGGISPCSVNPQLELKGVAR